MKTKAVLQLVEENGHTGLVIKGKGTDLMDLIALAAAEMEYTFEPGNRTEFRTVLIEKMHTARNLKWREEINENFKY